MFDYRRGNMSKTCDICGRGFAYRQNLWRHKKKHGEDGSLNNEHLMANAFCNADNERCDEGSVDGSYTDESNVDESYSDESDLDGSYSDESDTCDNDKEFIEDISKYVVKRNGQCNRNHSPLLPRDIRALVCGKSGAGKSVLLAYLLLEPNMLDYNNLIVCGPSLHQPMYDIMNKGFSMNLSKDQIRTIFENQNMITSIDSLFDTYDGRRKGGVNAEFIEDVNQIPDPSQFDERKKNLLVVDDVLLGPQNKIEDMYTRGRHNGIDTFYLAQNYFKLPRQTIRENANFIIMFPQDMKNLNHIYNDHCSADGITCAQFHDFCSSVWKSGKHKYVILDLTRNVDDGKYRSSLNGMWNPDENKYETLI